MIRHCVVCGAEYSTPPSNNKRTCSPVCSAAWRSRQHKGRHNTWSAAGFRQLKRSMAGKLRRKNGAPYTASTYKGWTLVAVEDKNESADD